MRRILLQQPWSYQHLEEDISEFMMTGLRLRKKVFRKRIQTRFGKSIRGDYKKEVDELLRLESIEKQTSAVLKTSEVCLRLTKRGRLLGNQGFMRFI